MIYLFYGADGYSIKQTIDAIAQNFSEKIVLDEDLSTYEVHLSHQSLFDQQPLLIFRDFLRRSSKSEQEKLEQALPVCHDDKSRPELIFWEGEKLDKRLSLAKWLLRQARTHEFKPPNLVKVREWVRKKVQELSVSLDTSSASVEKTKGRFLPELITAEAIQELLRLHGNNLWAIDNELKKLTTYAHERTITLEDIKRMCSRTNAENIFSFTDAIGNKNKVSAMQLFPILMRQNPDLGYLFAMLVRQFRLLLMMKADKKIPRLHPFVIKKVQQQCRYWTMAGLKKTYRRLLEIDIDCKSGKKEMETELVLLMAEL